MVDIFYGTRGKHDAKIMIVGEAFGSEEAAQQRPFVGGAGKVLDEMLRDAGLDINDCFLTNLIPEQPPGNDFTHYFLPGRGSFRNLNPKPELITSLENLCEQIRIIDPELIIACGNYPLWALTDVAKIEHHGARASAPDVPTGIGDYHGSQLYTNLAASPRYKVLPVYHPASIMREWTNRHTTVHDFRMRIPLALRDQWSPPRRTYYAPSSAAVITLYLDGLLTTANGRRVTLSVDVENIGPILTCIGLTHEVNSAISIPFVDLCSDKSLKSYWSTHDEARILKHLSAVFAHPNIYILGQNLTYDCQWFYHVLRMRPKVSFDTMIVQNLLFPGTKKSLGELSAMYCAHHRFWKDDNREWSTTGTLEQHLRYNCEDVMRTYEIAQEQMSVLAELDLLRFLHFELEKFSLAREMNERGIRRNPAKIADAGRRIVEQMSSLGSKLSRYVRQEWVPTTSKTPTPWYRSDAQIKFVLYTLLNLPPQVSRITGRPSSGKEALATLRESYPRLRKLFEALLDYGSLDTIYSTFIKSKSESNGRVHASFNPAGTATYRWSSSKNAFNRANNMQNIPVGGEAAGVDEGEVL